ncbi:MAG: ribosome biogenesis GTPase Der [Pseudomonadales bacterium]
MALTLALVGRPNVGKSTLFNRLTRGRDALVADQPGLTRDRRYGRAELEEGVCTLIDTGGLLGEDGELTLALERQAELAMDEADAVLFMVDARAGLTPLDQEIADRLRHRERRVVMVVNKIDGANEDAALAEFAALGFEPVVLVSAAHGRGMGALREVIAGFMAARADDQPVDASAQAEDSEAASEAPPERIRVAIIGRPNVGKSTLTNRLLGEERQVVFDAPGTTRDAIEIPFEREGRAYTLIDTAGVRRKGRVDDVAEKFSVVKTLQAIERAHVVILVLDAREGIVDQDLHLLSYAQDAGAGIIIAVNKWDGLSGEARHAVRHELDRRLRFAPWIPALEISALHGSGVGLLLGAVNRVYAAGAFEVSTTLLTRLLTDMVAAHPPPTVRGRQIKLRFAHKGGEHPPTIVIHGNQTQSLPSAYVRYLENGFREALDLVGTPVKIELRAGTNPFAGRKNPLTERQVRRRKRMVRHHKKKR